VVTNSGHGQLPGSPDAGWLYAKIHAHPERHDEIIAGDLPVLCAALGDDAGYGSCGTAARTRSDHLRLRLRIPDRAPRGVRGRDRGLGAATATRRRRGPVGLRQLPARGRPLRAWRGRWTQRRMSSSPTSRAVAAGLRHVARRRHPPQGPGGREHGRHRLRLPGARRRDGLAGCPSGPRGDQHGSGSGRPGGAPGSAQHAAAVAWLAERGRGRRGKSAPRLWPSTGTSSPPTPIPISSWNPCCTCTTTGPSASIWTASAPAVAWPDRPLSRGGRSEEKKRSVKESPPPYDPAPRWAESLFTGALGSPCCTSSTHVPALAGGTRSTSGLPP